MLVMTGDRKKEACGKLDGFKKQVGEDGLTQIMKCGGDFPKAHQDAKAFCGSGGAGGKGTTTKKPGAGGKVTTTKKPGAGGGSSPLHLCNIAKMQAPHLKAMLVMTGDRKKEACGKLDGFKKQVGEDGLTQIMKCGGDFPKAYQDAKAFCGSGGAGGKGTTTKKPGAGGGSSPLHLCNIAKMQAPH